MTDFIGAHTTRRRSMLALEPAHRLPTKKILNRIEEANAVWYAGEE
jgi:hypothetical protein